MKIWKGQTCRYRTTSENSFIACVGSREQSLQIFLDLGGFRTKEWIDDLDRKGSWDVTGWPKLINVLQRSYEEHVCNRLEASELDWYYAVGRESCCLQAVKMELNCVATAWQEPLEELQVISEAHLRRQLCLRRTEGSISWTGRWNECRLSPAGKEKRTIRY